MDLDDYGPLLSAQAFLEIDFGERIKAELEDGIIYSQVRGPLRRMTVATNLKALLGSGARGTGFFALGSLFAVTTAGNCLRYPDVSVFGPNRRGREFDDSLTFDDPVIAAHVMPTDDRRWSRLVTECGAVPSMDTLLLVDWELERVVVAQRGNTGEWRVDKECLHDVELPKISLTIPRAEIFARD